VWGKGPGLGNPKLLRSLLLGLLCATIALGAFFYCRHFSDDAGVTLYAEAARCLLDGKPLQTCNPFYTYPPIVAFLSIPLVPLPLIAQNIVWYSLTIGGLLWGLHLIVPLAQRLGPHDWSMRELLLFYGVGIGLSLKFIFAAIASQSYDVLVVLFVLLGLTNLAKEECNGHSRAPFWTGLNFACAAALKATPLLFLPYLIVKRHFRAAAAMTIALVVLSLLPDLFSLARKSDGGYLMAWVDQVAHPALTEKMEGNLHTFWFSSNTNNNSLRGLVGAFVTDETPHAFSRVLYPVYAAYGLVVGLIILASGTRAAAVTVDGAVLLISMLLLSPMSSESHYVALPLALFAVTVMWIKGDAGVRRTATCCLIVNFLLVNAAARDIVGTEMTNWAKDHRLLVIGTLLLLVPFALLVLRWAPASSALHRFVVPKARLPR
jgi:Glycosyltransferase family 87